MPKNSDIISKTSKATKNVVSTTGKVASDVINKTGKIADKILSKTSKYSIKNSVSKKPVEIDFKSLKLSIQISSFIKILLFSLFLTYVLKLEKKNCECSEGWERKYIKYYSIAVILFALLQIFATELYLKYRLIHTLLGVGGLVFIFSVVKYIRDLKEEDCDCSESWKRTALNIYAWLSIILLLITLVGTFYLASKMKN